MRSPPKSVIEAIETISNLPLPSREYEDMLRRQKAELEAAHKEHDKHGARIQRWVGQRFRLHLGPRYSIDTNRSRGYLLDWSYATGKNRHRVPVRPYVHVEIYLPHGREVGPATNSHGSSHGDGRCSVKLTYFPHSAEDLGEWCEKWIRWLKEAPAPKKAANLQVSM